MESITFALLDFSTFSTKLEFKDCTFSVCYRSQVPKVAPGKIENLLALMRNGKSAMRSAKSSARKCLHYRQLRGNPEQSFENVDFGNIDTCIAHRQHQL